MSETPIYDQLRGERINADVPATWANPQQVDHPARTRLLDETAGAEPMFGRPPGPGGAHTAGQRHSVATEPAERAMVNTARQAEPTGKARLGGRT